MASQNSLQQERLKTFITRLPSLRSQRCYSDAVIVCQDQEFPVHRVILVAGSNYFSTVFRTNMAEASTGRIELHGVDAETLNTVLDFLYGVDVGNMDDDEEKLMSVLCASHLLQVDVLYQHCWQRLRLKVNSSNFAAAWKLAELFQNAEILKWLVDMLMKNFWKTMKSADFLEINLSQLQQLLNHPVSRLVNTQKLLELVLNWGRHKERERSIDVGTIFHDKFEDKLQKLSTAFLDSMRRNPFVQPIPGVIDKVLEEIIDRGLRISSNCRDRKYQPLSRSNPTLSTGGKDGKPAWKM